MSFTALGEKRRGRRWFLGASGSAVAAAALAAAGCGGGDSARPSPAGSKTPQRGQSPAPTPQPQSRQRGGTLQYTGFVQGDGIADPHRTEAGPFYGQQSMVYSRLLTFKSQATQDLSPDLATGMPEQADPQTLTFHLNPGAHWHDSEPVKGRPVTSDDVKLSISRQQGDTSFPWSAHWDNIDNITTPDDATITFHFKSPLAPMVSYFAGVNAFIVPSEVVSAGFTMSDQVGSGPFTWVDWQEGKFASVARNPHWFGGNQRPFLDAAVMTQPHDATEIEAGLRVKQFDAATVARPQADRLMSAIPDLKLIEQGHSLFYGMRFIVTRPPFNDVRVRTALTIALDRAGMAQRFFAGSAEPNPWVSWPVTKWALPQAELQSQPGYHTDPAGRAKDIADAKAMLSAAGTPANLDLRVLDQAENSLQLGTSIWSQLKVNLGLDITVSPVSLAQLGKGLIAGGYSWAAAPDVGWIDLDDWVFPYFHSTGSRNSFALRDADLDKAIEAQRTELDPTKRQQLGYQVQRQLLALNAGVNFLSEKVLTLSWPYVKAFPTDASDGYQDRFADCWLDKDDPSYHGR
ncbi:ABC transporter substrate-binding protein [bacterium]|nr:ABC transporter substrate-binding protein [bacterium]